MNLRRCEFNFRFWTKIVLILLLNIMVTAIVSAADWEYQSLKISHGRYCVDIGDARNDGIFRVYWGYGYNGPVAREYEYDIEAGTWTEKDLPNATWVNGQTNGVAIGKGKNDGYNYIYFAGNSDKWNTPIGRVAQCSWSGSSWTLVEIATAALSMTDIAVGNANYLNNTSNQQIYAGNADGHVYMYNWNGTSYSRIVVGTATAGITAIAIGEGLSVNVTYRCVYAVSSDSHVYQFRWNTSGYFEKVIVGTAPASLNDIAVWNKSGDYEQLFVAASDGHIYDFQYGVSWQMSDLGQSDSANPMKKVVVGEGRNDEARRVYAVAENDALYEFSYSGSWIKTKIAGSIVNTLGIGEARNVPGLNSILVMPSGGDVPLTEYCYDSIAPSAVTSLTAETGNSLTTVKLSWLSPGDDGTIGIIWNDSVNSNNYYNDVGRFRIDYATYPKTWNYADYEVEIATITSYGDFNSYIVSGLLDAVTYYFCLWTCDNVGNWSQASNISAAPAGALSGTYVYNDITDDTFWTASGSPYVINTNLTISSGTTLTIDPGVTVKFRGNYSIINNGIIDAQGDPGDHISFEYYISSAQVPGSWNQIYIYAPYSGYVQLNYCDIKGAAIGLNFESQVSGNQIYNTTFSSCTTGIAGSVNGMTRLYIASSTFSDCGIGTTANYYAMTDCYFVKNATAVRSARGTVSNSLFENNYSAIYNPGSQPSGFSVTKSSFISNTNYAFYAEMDLTYCYFENNGVAAYVDGSRKTIGNTLTGNATGFVYVLSASETESEFHHNNITGSAFHDLVVNAGHNVDLSYNWWGTTVTAVIDQKIDDINNTATYTPVLGEPYVYSPSPLAIIDLTALISDVGGSVDLAWTAPLDDNGAWLTAYDGYYRIKYSQNPSYSFSVSDYSTEISRNITPGEKETLTINGLTAGVTYYFCVWAADSDGNWSADSNISSASASGYTISGYLLDQSSNALTEAYVSLTGASNATANADANGYYEFTSLPGGDYTLTPYPTEYAFAPASFSTTSLSGNISSLNFFGTYTPYSISGTAYDYSGNGIYNVKIAISVNADDGHWYTKTIYTDSSGHYSKQL